MLKQAKSATARMRAVLAALVRETRGNALMIMTAALIPLAGMVGGGVDISRMYILKTRLQHACDAGALAGRKAMGGGTWSYASYYPRTEAEKFFDANIDDTAFGSTGMTRSFSENAGKVTGTASATIPMTLMRIFGRTTETLAVTCATEMRLPNTDVMFVLDTTGSMGDPQPGDSVTKMEALKVAVKCFYEIVARLDTDANCSTGTPSGGTGDQVQIRFGFVPYATNANVGKLLKHEWMADNWSYQSRRLVAGGGGTTTTVGAWSGESGWTLCSSVPGSSATLEVQTTQTGSLFGIAICKYRTRTITTTTGGPALWHYGLISQNVSGLKKPDGVGWNDDVTLNVENGGGARTIAWDGCIEERQTVRATSYWPIPANAKDLNIDLVPTSDVSTRWGPVLPNIIFTRKATNNSTTSSRNSAPSSFDRTELLSTSSDYGKDIYYACPVAAKKLQSWPNADLFDDYVDSLQPEGNTYHDIGLIWGARLASPEGIFGAENKVTNRGGEIERHIIFMTDGDACTGINNYGAYGVPWFDRRQTSDSAEPTSGCSTNDNTLTEQVNKRTEALCNAIRNHTSGGRQSFTLWVIAFGNLATETETRLSTCATPGRYFKATSAPELQATFKAIADQISMLRLTQ